MEVPLIIGAAIGGLLVETHGVRESSLEQIIVANGDAAHDVAEEIPLVRAELIEGSEMALAQDQRFEWPNSPEGHDDCKGVVLTDNAQIQLQLQFQIVTEEAGAFFDLILTEGRQLPSGKIWQRSIRPNLAVWVRIAGAQQLATIFEDLYVVNPRDLCECGVLLGPAVNDSAQFRDTRPCNREIMPRRKTHHAANSLLGLPYQQASRIKFD